MACYGILRPQLPHERQLLAVEPPCEIATQLLPAVTTIGAAKQIIRAHVHRPVVVRRDHDRSAPVPAEILLAEFRLGLDAFSLSGPYVVADDSAVLRFRVNDVRVGWIDGGVEAVASHGHVPVVVGDSLTISCLTRTRPAVV